MGKRCIYQHPERNAFRTVFATWTHKQNADINMAVGRSGTIICLRVIPHTQRDHQECIWEWEHIVRFILVAIYAIYDI